MSIVDFERLTKSGLPGLLRSEREHSKYSVECVSRLLNTRGLKISTKTLYGYESGVSMPKLSTFLALCDIYGVSDALAALGMGEGRRGEGLSPSEWKLVELYRSATPAARLAAVLKLQEPRKEPEPSNGECVIYDISEYFDP